MAGKLYLLLQVLSLVILLPVIFDISGIALHVHCRQFCGRRLLIEFCDHFPIIHGAKVVAEKFYVFAFRVIFYAELSPSLRYDVVQTCAKPFAVCLSFAFANLHMANQYSQEIQIALNRWVSRDIQ